MIEFCQIHSYTKYKCCYYSFWVRDMTIFSVFIRFKYFHFRCVKRSHGKQVSKASSVWEGQCMPFLRSFFFLNCIYFSFFKKFLLSSFNFTCLTSFIYEVYSFFFTVGKRFERDSQSPLWPPRTEGKQPRESECGKCPSVVGVLESLTVLS